MVQLTPLQEKLFNYLVSHKKPVTIAKLAYHFLVAPSMVSRALLGLHHAGLADRKRVNRQFFYEIKQ